MVRRWIGCSIGLGVWLTASGAFAQSGSERVSLVWSAPAECPDRAQLVREIEALLGQSLPSSGGQALAVAVSVQGDLAQGYAGKISFASSPGNEVRYLEHASCEQLVHAFALVTALAIDPERVRASQSARDAGRETAATPREKPASEATASERAAPPLRSLPVPERNHEPRAMQSPLRGARIALHGLAGAGPQPRLGTGLQAALGFHHGHLRFDVVGRYWFSRDVQTDELPGVKLELELATLGARACWLPLSGAWQVSACVGGDVGELRGTGRGIVENSHTNRARYSQLAAGIQAAYTRFRLAPELGFELSGALEQPPFGVVRDGRNFQMFRPPGLGFCAFLGIAFEL